MTKEEVFANKDLLIAEKKSALKKGDNVLTIAQPNEANTNKAEAVVTGGNMDVLKARLVINTTNVIDSHMDCHIPGLWNKTLQETKSLFLLQEHKMSFENVIADSLNDGLKASAVTMRWRDLGYPWNGKTEALIFETSIKKDVNEYMFDLYRKGRVNNHSVGMQYVKIYLCINSEEAMYSSEKANWDKYYPQVVNKEIADEKGYFWAVTEAKVVEGSAVVKGSNSQTPSLEIEIEKEEPTEVTQDTTEPAIEVTQKNEMLKELLNKF